MEILKFMNRALFIRMFSMIFMKEYILINRSNTISSAEFRSFFKQYLIVQKLEKTSKI